MSQRIYWPLGRFGNKKKGTRFDIVVGRAELRPAKRASLRSGEERIDTKVTVLAPGHVAGGPAAVYLRE